MSEQKYVRRILVAVTGTTPQVITETLYALVVEKHFIPTEIHLLTTLNGRNRAMRDLLDPHDGKFHEFCREYGLEGRIIFSEKTVHVIKDTDGNPLTDIRTPEENTLAANLIAKTIKEFCQDENSQLHVSIAGGRKSMGFFIGYALSIFGRHQDQMSHVLVPEPFEKNKDFFYPTQHPSEIYAADGSALNTKDAKVMLADIPIVLLRDGLPKDLLQGDCSYMEAVTLAQRNIIPAKGLRFHKQSMSVDCGGISVKLAPVQFATYYWLAKRRQEQLDAVRPGVNIRADEFLAFYKAILPPYSADYEKACQALRHPEDFLPYFQERRSRINSVLKAQLGSLGSKPYLVQTFGKRPQTQYGLSIEPDLILFD